MKNLLILLTATWILSGCAAYKQLEPMPPIASDEGGYLPVRKDDKLFELKKEKQYFLSFPAPTEKYFYLLVKMPNKKEFTAFLTDSLADATTYGKKIPDEYRDSAALSVYAVSNARPAYYLLMEGISSEFPLTLEYRYVPQWRFKFENKYAYYREIIKQNAVDRTYYKSVGEKVHFESFNFTLAMDTAAKHLEVLTGIYNEFLELESIFPKSIINSDDKDYQNYSILRKVLEDEMRFQKDYLFALIFFNREYQSRGNTGDFIRAVGDFTAFFKEKERIASNVVQEGKSVMATRLAEVPLFYDQRLPAKEDGKPFDPEGFLIEPALKLPALHEAAGLPAGPESQALYAFLKDFDSRSRTLVALKDSLDQARKAVKDSPEMPANGFFGNMQARLTALEKRIPGQLAGEYGKQASLKCLAALNADLILFGSGVVKLAQQCREAEEMIVQLNALREQGDFPGMLALLLQKPNLAFLQEKYRGLDKMSVDAQAGKVRTALSGANWGAAESGLSRLFQDKNFINPAQIKPVREKIVGDLEDTLYSTIERVTRVRVDRFLEEKVHTLENVDSLYSDSAFLPVYDVTFSSGTKAELLMRKTELVAQLAKLKENEFPAKAIRLLYEEFIKAPHDSGVYKAKAIVVHGSHYKGDDKDVKTRMAECDPLSAKWIVKPKDYRRVFALPVTDKKTGKNRYMVRLNVDIPTEAQFPVYDVNIKLPKDLAGNAAAEQWYEQITLNRKALKNEGRFSISAPTAANEYECQITPVQMNKDGKNILEVTFNWPSYRVFTLSVMVQKPIIKKN